MRFSGGCVFQGHVCLGEVIISSDRRNTMQSTQGKVCTVGADQVCVLNKVLSNWCCVMRARQMRAQHHTQTTHGGTAPHLWTSAVIFTHRNKTYIRAFSRIESANPAHSPTSTHTHTHTHIYIFIRIAWVCAMGHPWARHRVREQPGQARACVFCGLKGAQHHTCGRQPRRHPEHWA